MQYRNPEGYFSTSHLPWCFQSRILPRFFLKSRVPSFKYGKFRILKTYWGHCIRYYEALNYFKSSKLYEALLKIAINLRSHDHFKVMIYLKNLWKQVAIKWRGTDLNFPSANVVQVRHCRDNEGVTIAIPLPQFCCEYGAWIASFNNVPLNTIIGSKSLYL